MDVKEYWKAVLQQNPTKISEFFCNDAYINWHNTNEHFTVDEFVTVNCLYPGKWDSEIERIEYQENLIISVVRVFSKTDKTSFHVTSFFTLENDKISVLDEYWGDDGIAPQWRIDKHIGSALQ